MALFCGFFGSTYKLLRLLSKDFWVSLREWSPLLNVLLSSSNRKSASFMRFMRETSTWRYYSSFWSNSTISVW